MFPLEKLRVGHLPLPQRVVLSLTLIVLGIGYAIAMVNLYLTYNLTDGQPGMTPEDMRRAFYGQRENTKLASKINGGSMAQFLPKPGDKEKILSWIQDGAERDGFEVVVKPIVDQNCVRCHNPNGLQRFAPLTSYEQVMTVTQIDRGEPVSLWTRVAHTHIQSIGLIFLVLGGAFSFTSLSTRVKVLILVLPFAALLLDFGARLMAKLVPAAVYVMMAAGGLMGTMFGVMILVPLYEMWVKREKVY